MKHEGAQMTESIDKDGPPSVDSGLFGLDVDREQAKIVAIPAPFEVTVSYRTGTARGPEAIRLASHQIDLFDLDVGDLERTQTHLAEPPALIAKRNAWARPKAESIIAALTAGVTPDAATLADVNKACAEVHQTLRESCAEVLAEGKIPLVIGGDHSVAFGPISAGLAHAEEQGWGAIGVLQVDAHADLRDAYEGFEHSHASVMHNVLKSFDAVKLVQVGIRDVSEDEMRQAEEDPRVLLVADRALRRHRLKGTIAAAFEKAVSALPHRVWLSIDIDGLEPALCPHTGTPVPGGLDFDEFVLLIEAVVESGREIIGMDLCEVAPGPDDEANAEWDATVGARVLAKMCGFAVRSQGER